MSEPAPKRSAALDAAGYLGNEWQDEQSDIFTLDAAISAVEAGQVTGPLQVDFGTGLSTKVSPGPGLLQRLKGHRMLTAIASGSADLSAPRSAKQPVWVDDQVSEMLGAVPKSNA